MSKTDSPAPYSLFEGNSGGCLIAELGKEKLALPYLALRQIAHSEEPESIVMEFTENSVQVHGKGLGQLFELLAGLRVKAIRIGCEEKGPCKIEKVEVLNG